MALIDFKLILIPRETKPEAKHGGFRMILLLELILSLLLDFSRHDLTTVVEEKHRGQYNKRG